MHQYLSLHEDVVFQEQLWDSSAELVTSNWILTARFDSGSCTKHCSWSFYNGNVALFPLCQKTEWFILLSSFPSPFLQSLLLFFPPTTVGSFEGLWNGTFESWLLKGSGNKTAKMLHNVCMQVEGYLHWAHEVFSFVCLLSFLFCHVTSPLTVCR